MQIAIDVLKSMPLLQTLSDEQLKAAGDWLGAHKVETNEIIVKQGSPSNGIFIVLQGQFKIVTYDIENQECGLLFIGDKSFVGELSILDDIPSSATVIAAQPSWVLRIPRQVARTLIETNPQFSNQIMRRLAQALRSTNEKVMMLSAKSQWRVYYFLRSLGARQGTQIIGKLPTHQTIASMINLSRETVTRNLKQLQQIGLIQLGVLNSEKVFIIEAEQKVQLENQSPANC